jgi:hypothetical protein
MKPRGSVVPSAPYMWTVFSDVENQTNASEKFKPVRNDIKLLETRIFR